MPTRFISPKCLLCNQPTTQEHLLITYPRKDVVWSQVARQFLEDPRPISPRDILQVRVLRCCILSHYALDWPHIVACTLLVIWKAHWQKVFNDIAFDSSSGSYSWYSNPIDNTSTTNSIYSLRHHVTISLVLKTTTYATLSTFRGGLKAVCSRC